MSAVLVGLCAASVGATIGLVIGGLLACGRGQDLEIAYRRLRVEVLHLLESHASSNGDVMIPAEQWQALSEALADADLLVFPEAPPRRPCASTAPRC